jgi:hypothetical protein
VVALKAETGAGLPDATTLATRAELIAFAALRGIVIPDEDASDVHLVNAMDYLATLPLLGNPVVADQGTPFPRLYYRDVNSDVPTWPVDAVPAGAKRAQLLLAVASFQGITLLGQRSAGRQLKSRDVGPLKRSYGEESYSHAQVAGVDEALAPYIIEQGGFRLVTGRA